MEIGHISINKLILLWFLYTATMTEVQLKSLITTARIKGKVHFFKDEVLKYTIIYNGI